MVGALDDDHDEDDEHRNNDDNDDTQNNFCLPWSSPFCCCCYSRTDRRFIYLLLLLLLFGLLYTVPLLRDQKNKLEWVATFTCLFFLPLRRVRSVGWIIHVGLQGMYYVPLSDRMLNNKNRNRIYARRPSLSSLDAFPLQFPFPNYDDNGNGNDNSSSLPLMARK